jgi:hypothetical protein
MPQMATTNRTILADADVVSHFVTAGEEAMLNKIFPGHPVCILDKVHRELQQWRSAAMCTKVSLLLSKKIVRLIDFPDDNGDIVKEYAWIKSRYFMGDGEAACLAVARYNQNILASSNLKDIKTYCNTHKIDYLTTMDFLCHALKTGIFTLVRCDTFISTVLAASSKLPVKSMREYQCRDIVL